MARVTVASGDHGFELSDFVSHEDVRGLSLRNRSATDAIFDGQNGFFIRITGSFPGTFTSVWSVNSIEIGRNGQTALSLNGASVNFTEWTGVTTVFAFERLFFDGNDHFSSQSNDGDLYTLGTGDDTVNAGAGDDTVFGGSGDDLMVIDSAFSDARLSLFSTRTGQSTPGTVTIESRDGDDVISGVERLQFGNRTFELNINNNSSNELIGSARNDALISGNGDDTLAGQSGTDILIGGGGDDVLNGGSGRDRLEGNDGSDILRGGSGSDTLVGNSGNDRLIGNAGNDDLIGGGGRDRMFGGGRNDELRGGGGRDLLNGGGGRDTLLGGSGDDTLSGRNGDDRLVGQRGTDTLFGGGGNDVFHFNRNDGQDVIRDFEIGEDLISIGRGANSVRDLEFETLGDDVWITFANVGILVEDVDANDLIDADNFLF